MLYQAHKQLILKVQNAIKDADEAMIESRALREEARKLVGETGKTHKRLDATLERIYKVTA